MLGSFQDLRVLSTFHRKYYVCLQYRNPGSWDTHPALVVLLAPANRQVGKKHPPGPCLVQVQARSKLLKDNGFKDFALLASYFVGFSSEGFKSSLQGPNLGKCTRAFQPALTDRGRRINSQKSPESAASPDATGAVSC